MTTPRRLRRPQAKRNYRRPSHVQRERAARFGYTWEPLPEHLHAFMYSVPAHKNPRRPTPPPMMIDPDIECTLGGERNVFGFSQGAFRRMWGLA